MKNFAKKIASILVLGSLIVALPSCSTIGVKPLNEEQLNEYAEEHFDNYEITKYTEGGDKNVLYLYDDLYKFEYEIISEKINKGGLDGSTGRGKTLHTYSTWCDELSSAVEDLAKDKLDAIASDYDCEYKFTNLGVSFANGSKAIIATITIRDDRSDADIEEVAEAFADVFEKYNYGHYLDKAYVQAYVAGDKTYGQVKISDMTWEYGTFQNSI